MLYTLTNLTKVYEDRTVLDIPSLDIERGDICAFLGPNGAGKTTLLHILSFLESPTAGDILFDASPVQQIESHLHRLRRNVILVDQQPILFTTSVYRNLEFALKIRQIPPEARKSMIEEALDLVGMGSFAQAPAGKLSGGETQRVALARGIVAMPDVLLCDEPTASVDMENQATIVSILKRINEEKKITVLFTTHDRFQAASLAGQIFHLDQGRLALTGSENLFSAVLTPTGTKGTICTLHDNVQFPIPQAIAGPREGKVRIKIRPDRLILRQVASRDNGETPEKDQIRGRAVQITEEKGHIRIVVDAGIWITLLLSKDTYRENPTLAGETVTLSIPAKAIQILPEE